jgi:hypothetical protein
MFLGMEAAMVTALQLKSTYNTVTQQVIDKLVLVSIAKTAFSKLVLKWIIDIQNERRFDG